MIKLKRIKENCYGNIVYQDQDTNIYYVDISNNYNGEPDLYTCAPPYDMDGEPDSPLKRDYEIINPISERERLMQQYRFTYMMLYRLQDDCKGYFGSGNPDSCADWRFQNELFVWGQDIKELVEEMKKLWKMIPCDLKPEWITWDEIVGYANRINTHCRHLRPDRETNPYSNNMFNNIH